MNFKMLICILASTLSLGAIAEAQYGTGGRALTFYSGTDFSGQSVTINDDVTNFQTINFNDRALSIRVQGRGSWTVCQHANFSGVCREISNDVPNLATISLDGHISSARMEFGSGGRPGGGYPGGGYPGGARGDGSLTLYAGPNFSGQSINIDRETRNFTRLGFNDRAMSAEVEGRGRWTICEDANFGTPCRTISGRIPNLNAYGLGNRLSSAQPEYGNGGGYGGPGYGGPGSGYGSRAGTLVLFSGPNFTGQSIELDREESNFVRIRFNDQAMSAIAYGNESWTVCEDVGFGTPCRTISGQMRNLNALGLGNRISSARPEYGYGGPGDGYGGPGGNYGGGYGGPGGGGYNQYDSITLYAGPNFTGPSVTIDRDTYNLDIVRFNDRAMSMTVNGRGNWLLCEHASFAGRCHQFDRDVRNLNQWGLGNQVSSVQGY